MDGDVGVAVDDEARLDIELDKLDIAVVRILGLIVADVGDDDGKTEGAESCCGAVETGLTALAGDGMALV